MFVGLRSASRGWLQIKRNTCMLKRAIVGMQLSVEDFHLSGVVLFA